MMYLYLNKMLLTLSHNEVVIELQIRPISIHKQE